MLLFSLLSYFYNTNNVCLRKSEATFWFIKLSLLGYISNSGTYVFKSNRRLLFNLFNYFSSWETCAFKSSGRLLFRLFSYFGSSETCVFKSHGRLLFLFYSVNFAIHNMCVHKKPEAAFVIQKMYVQNKQEAAF